LRLFIRPKAYVLFVLHLSWYYSPYLCRHS